MLAAINFDLYSPHVFNDEDSKSEIIAKLRSRVLTLETKIAKLRLMIRRMATSSRKRAGKAEIFDNGNVAPLQSTQAKGSKFDTYIAGLTHGKIMKRGSPYDVESGNGTKLEVKFSKLSPPKGTSKSTRDWTWSDILGRNRDKVFDRLILVGESNPDYRNQYAEPKAKYVLFDIPFAELGSVYSVKHNLIQLNSNPSRIWKSAVSRHSLYAKFQTTAQRLGDNYSLRSNKVHRSVASNYATLSKHRRQRRSEGVSLGLH